MKVENYETRQNSRHFTYTSTNARALHRAKKEAQNTSCAIVHHFLYPILINADDKVKRGNFLTFNKS